VSDDTNTAGGFEYPDGSAPAIDPATGQPILEDRTADFPDEAAEATEVVGEPVFSRQVGGGGLSAPYGLMAKRAARRLGIEPETTDPDSDADDVEDEGGTVTVIDGQGQEGTPEVPEAPGGDDDTSEEPEGSEDGAEDPADEDRSDAGEPDESVEDESTETPDPEDEEDDEDVTVPDDAFEPADHTVAEVQSYLADHPDQTEYVLDRERTGKARVSLIGA